MAIKFKIKFYFQFPDIPACIPINSKENGEYPEPDATNFNMRIINLQPTHPFQTSSNKAITFYY